jgi:hypothetical protein
LGGILDTKDLDEKEKPVDGKEVEVDKKLVQIIIDNSSDISLDDFQVNDKKILSLLNQDSDISDTKYTFNGLVRKLGIHQQSLARSLHRLESAGLVTKTDYGYKLAKNLDSVLVKKSRIVLEHMSKKISGQNVPFEQILQLYVPTTVTVEQVVAKLFGKWFGSLRWLGMVQGDGGYILQWEGESKYHVNLKIVSRYAVIESNAAGDKNKSEAMIDAHRIVEQITKLLKTNTEASGGKTTRDFGLYN